MIDRIKTNCPRDCYDGCGIVVERRSGESHRVLGDPDHPVSRGKLCSKCAVAYNGVWQDKTQRLLHPLRRVGPKGSTDFERISWDEALAAVADKMNAAIDSSPVAVVEILTLLWPDSFGLVNVYVRGTSSGVVR